MEEKHFREWMEVKQGLHEQNRVIKIREGEVYWCGFGENVGVEINGKNAMFSRPVLVYKKLGPFEFLGVPLTSKAHCGSWYVEFKFQGRMENAVLAQIRIFSIARLYTRMGQVDEEDMKRIRTGFRRLYCS